MTPALLLDSLRSRGVHLEAHGLRLHYIGNVTDEDLTLLREYKAELLALLRNKQQAAIAHPDYGWALGTADALCGLCGSQPLAWVEDWPTAGENRWLCPTCAAWPTPALAEVFAGLTGDERHRFDTEVASGDRLSVAVLRELRGDRRAAS
jgi:hypothetical protein